MLRRHFITGEDKPDIILTYHSSKHIPFFGSKETRNLLMYASYGNMEDTDDFNSPISINIVLDTWNDGVGQWGIKFNDSKVFNCYGSIISILDNEYVSGSAENYLDFKNNEIISNSGYIESIIFDDNITHINGSIIVPGNNNESILKDVTLPNSLKYLTGSTFIGHKNLKSLIIPENVIRIDDLVCIYNELNSGANNALEEITLLPVNPPLVNNGNYGPLGSKSSGELINSNFKIRVYADCLDTYKNDSVWGQYSDLYDTINNAIIYYINNERYLYTEQTDIISVSYAQQWKQATTILLPNTIKEIDGSAFSECENLTTLEIPKNVIRFTGSIYNTPINTIRWNAINSSEYNNGYIFGPIKTQISLFVIGDIVEHIPSGLCKGMSNINSIEIPDSVVSVGQNAFYDCSSLKSISIGKSISTIGQMSFYNINRTESISVFISDLTAWCNITFEGSLANPLESAYNNNQGLDSNLYLNNELLTHLEISTSINIIKLYAFSGCSSIISITIPESVTSIEKYALAYCKNLRNIIYNGSIEQWNNVIKANDWDRFVPATYVQCTDGQVPLT